MNRRILALLCAAASVAGCGAHSVEGVTCDSNADCNGGTCQNNLCVGAGTNAGSGSSGSGATSGSSGSNGSSGSSGTTGVFACDGGCTAPDYCDTRNGSCKNAYTVRFTTPLNAGDWADGGTHKARVHVGVAAASGLVDADSVTLAVTLGADAGCGGATIDLSKSSGPGSQSGSGTDWAGDWNPEDAGVTADTPVTLCASAFVGDAGLVGQDVTLVNVDVTPPSLNPTPSRDPQDRADPGSGFNEAYARDEDPLTVDSGAIDTGSGLAGVSFEFEYPDSGPVGGVTMTASGTPPSADLNLQKPPLGEHGKFQVGMTAVDNVGNVSTGAVTVKITRWKWVADAGTGAPVLMPAVAGGVIYAAAAGGSIPEGVLALSAADGSQLWKADLASNPILPPAVAPTNGDSLFSVRSGGNIAVLYTTDGGNVGQYSTNATQLQSMAVSVDPGGALIDTADVASYGAYLYGIQADGSQFTGPMSVQSGAFGGVVDSRADTFFSVKQPGGFLGLGSDYALGHTSQQSTTAAFYAPTSIASLTEDPTSGGTTKAAFGPVADGANYFLYSDASSRSVMHVSGASETPPAGGLGTSAVNEIVVAASGVALIPLDDGTFARATVFGNNLIVTKIPIDATNGLLTGSAHVYAVGNSNGGSPSAVTAFDTQGQLPADGGIGPIEWHIGLPQQASSAPGMACARPGSGEALLLVPTMSGSLYALVVDDTGLNQSAPWPKARHDALNTANAWVQNPVCP